MNIRFGSIIKGTLFALIATFAIIFILSLISYFASVSETVITTGVYASVIIGVLLGSAAVSKAAVSKKFLHAMLVCAVYLLVFLALSMIVNKEISFNTHLMAVAGGVFAAGLLGSIIGK